MSAIAIGELASKLRARLVDLPRLHKRLLLVLNDFALLSFALWLALSFRYMRLYEPETTELAVLLVLAPVIGVAVFLWGGVYRVVTRYMSAAGTTRLVLLLGLSVLFWALALVLSRVHDVPRSVILLYAVLGAAFLSWSRQLAAWLLKGAGVAIPRQRAMQRAVAIYGAGQSGKDLLEALIRSGDHDVVGFLDTRPSLVGQYIGGVKVYRPEKLASMIARQNVSCIYLAQTDATRRERAETLKWLQMQPVRVQLLPTMEDLASARVSVGALREVEVDDLLTREQAPALPHLIGRAAREKSVMVTGAGGSIGSELVRHLLRHGVVRIVLFEMGELALYQIEMEARAIVQKLAALERRPEIVAVLGSIRDEELVSRTLERYGVETIYHAAAYKHVPLVEANVVSGLDNNVFGTAVLVAAARRHGVERFVLISSDKAVRPPNVMGASKRLAEMILQANAAEPGCECVFSIVRFGNVLDSSGSVVRLFRKQIMDGGPVTVTHPDVIRYFMSIPEAVDLVLQAAGLGSGGDVFLLEMGEPMRIDELARTMIRLAGLEVRDGDHPDGDIEVEYTGLRPGEKLFEELLIDGAAIATEHSRIFRSEEPSLPLAELGRELEALKLAMAANDIRAVQAVLGRVVEGYRVRDAEAVVAPAGGAQWVASSRMVH